MLQAANKRAAHDRAERLRPDVERARAAGATSVRAPAEHLDHHRVDGRGWSRSSAARLLQRLAA